MLGSLDEAESVKDVTVTWQRSPTLVVKGSQILDPSSFVGGLRTANSLLRSPMPWIPYFIAGPHGHEMVEPRTQPSLTEFGFSQCLYGLSAGQ